MTNNQILRLTKYLARFNHNSAELHHGDCIGADAQCAKLALEQGFRIIKHPPINTSKQANTIAHVEWPRKDYLVRNEDIVKESDLLLATPKEFEEQLRSGTWSTIRKALKMHKRVIIIFPDGTVEHHNII